MSLALDHFRALYETSALPASMPADTASEKLKQLITETQQLTLSQLPSSNARQLGSILFSHEGGLIAAFSALNPPRVKKQKSSVFSINLLFLALSLLTAAGAVMLAWTNGQQLASVFAAVSAILGCSAYFIPRRASTPQLEQSVDTRALFSLAQRRMEAIDRDLDAFLSIPSENSDSDDGMVHIITLANTLRRQDPESVPEELMTAIHALSISKGYDFLDYTPETEAFFDTMPTKRETRTIVPAVVKENTLISRGMAVVSLETAAAEA